MFLADDHVIVRLALRHLINSQSDMEVIGEAGDGREAVEKVLELNPDVAVVDLQMPKVGGIEAIRLLSQSAPKTRAIAVTMHDDLNYVRFVLAAGGVGFVPKRLAHSEVTNAIRAVAAGRAYIEAGLVRGEPSLSSGLQDIAPLSDREVQVLTLSAEGHTAHEIGEQLDISSKTVEGYRSRVRIKLALETRADLVGFALEAGLLRPKARL